MAGFLAAPLNDLGRVAEFRQTYRAARRIIGPAVELPATTAEIGTGAAWDGCGRDGCGRDGRGGSRAR